MQGRRGKRTTGSQTGDIMVRTGVAQTDLTQKNLNFFQKPNKHSLSLGKFSRNTNLESRTGGNEKLSEMNRKKLQYRSRAERLK